jgi:uncharacterized RDD family membrane protein YckC/DNA-directed RNA polymerase subunit RPC12/RpoP
MNEYTCEKCGSHIYEQVTQTQVRCLQCNHMSIFDGLPKKEFYLSPDAGLLDLVEREEHIPAPLVKRFINYFMDIFVLVLLMMVLQFLPIFSSTGTTPDDMLTVIVFLLLPVYYIFMEYKFGKTVGKFITRTKVVSTKDSGLTLGQCIKRALCRFIPFESISGLLFHGVFWHDSIPGTMVVDDK